MSKKSSHRKNDSGEINVFESARYFSDFHEGSGYNTNVSTLAQKIMRDEKQPWRGGRISLDIPNIRHSLPDSQTFVMERPTTIEMDRGDTRKSRFVQNKYLQPSSPGGKLFSFLNSIFTQASNKKKKAKSKSATQSLRDEEESPGGRRRRGFWSTSSTKKIGPKSPIYPSSTYRSIHGESRNGSETESSTIRTQRGEDLTIKDSSGCRTPSPYAYAKTKSYNNLQSYISHQHDSSYAKKHDISERKHKDHGFLSAKSRLSNGSNAEKYKSITTRFSESRTSSCSDHYISQEKKEFKKVNNYEDDDGDSDSSSDLFELPNFDLDFSSSGLPVYETTNVDSIKRGATTSSGITR